MTARDWLREALDDWARHARKYDVPLLLEPLNRYETKMVNTLAAGIELLDSLTTDNVRLLADFFHMNIEEPDMAAALRHAGSDLGHVHFVDSNREAAGRGHMEFEPLARCVARYRVRWFLSAEARPVPDSMTAAKTTMATFKRLFR